MMVASIVIVIAIWSYAIKKQEAMDADGNSAISGTDSLQDVITYNQEVGVIESDLSETDTMMYSIHYPQFSVETIDADIKKFVKKIKKTADKAREESKLNEKGIVYINYDSYLLGSNIASVNFYVEINLPGYANPITSISSKHYDLSDGEILSIEDLFHGDYIEAISQYCKNQIFADESIKDNFNPETIEMYLLPKKENFENFLLTKDGMIISFSHDKIRASFREYQVFIPYDELKPYLSFDYQSDKIEIPKREDMVIEETEKVKINPDKPMIALTFDDGPQPKVTNRILDILKQYNSRATFFVVGNRLNNFPDTLQRIVRENSEIGSHTYNHKSLSMLSKKVMKKEVTEVDKVLESIIGTKTAILRPPYGAVNDTVREGVNKPMIYWSVDTEDWKSRDTDKIVKHVMSNVKDGDVILFHDLYDTTAAAIEILVPKLVEQGYQIVTVSEMYEAKGIKLEPGKVYYNAR